MCGLFRSVVTAEAQPSRFIATSIFSQYCRPEWARWGDRRVAPLTIIDRITDHVGYQQLALAPRVRRDNRGVELHFHGATFPVDVIPGFLLRLPDQYSIYSLPGEDNQWIEASPARQSALFSISNAACVQNCARSLS